MPPLQADYHSLEVVLSEDVGYKYIVAQYQLPFTFNVVAEPLQHTRAPLAEGSRTRGQMEQLEEMSQLEYQRHVSPRFGARSQRDTGDARIDRPTLDINTFQGDQHRDGNSSSLSPSAAPLTQLSNNASSNSSALNALCPLYQAIALPRTYVEPTPTLTEVNPESGPVTGGERIWLKGTDFPTFPLFARFGTAVVPTVSFMDCVRITVPTNQVSKTFSAGNLLACQLPPATIAGVVDVSLSKYPQPSGPEYGISTAKFQYVAPRDIL